MDVIFAVRGEGNLYKCFAIEREGWLYVATDWNGKTPKSGTIPNAGFRVAMEFVVGRSGDLWIGPQVPKTLAYLGTDQPTDTRFQRLSPQELTQVFGVH